VRQVTVVHLSDLHLPLADKVAWSQMLNKRMLGFVNLRVLRGKHMSEPLALSMLRSAATEPADLFVVSGDLSNLALPGELERASTLLHAAGFAPDKTLVIPGNHDRYVPEAEASRIFERLMAHWLPVGFADRGEYPLVKKAGSILLIGLDTAVARGGIRSAGYLGQPQLDRLAAILRSEEHQGLWPVVALHHPPLPVGTSFLRQYARGLVGFAKLLRLLEPRGATLIHGHLHLQERRRLGKLEVVGVPSISKVGHSLRDAMGYHVYTFTQAGLKNVIAVRTVEQAQGPSVVRHELAAVDIG
jgi:3',5'-cyclic AMP phosphodiesterase CpdA